MLRFTFKEWISTYRPVNRTESGDSDSVIETTIPLVFDSSVIEDVCYVAKAKPESVWSLIENPDDGKWQIVSGVRADTRLGYLVTEKPHAHEPIEVDVSAA